MLTSIDLFKCYTLIHIIYSNESLRVNIAVLFITRHSELWFSKRSIQFLKMAMKSDHVDPVVTTLMNMGWVSQGFNLLW